VRPDVKILLTDLLAKLDNLQDFFLVFDQYTTKLQKQNVLAIRQALLAEQVVIFFPAGSVTKVTWRGIRDTVWMNGPVSCARKYQAPILPLAIDSRNSLLYYLIALINLNFSTALLTHEMFRKRGVTVPVRVGHLLPASSFTKSEDNVATQTHRLCEHVRLLKQGGTEPLTI
jgi:putative hemolysin